MSKKRNKVEIFKLEDRVLFEAGAVVQAAEAAAADQANNDAAGDGSAAAEMQSDNNQTASNELTPDNLAEMPVPPEMSGSDNADDTADADAADFAAADPESETVAFTDAPIAVSETSERILVVLNSSVADADSIVNDLGDNVEVLRLEAGTDALDTINDYLDEHADTKYSAIHLVSHGSEGYITLNGEKIDSTTINPADWKAIGEHLTDDADILVYGCDTAKSEEGKALVQTIANLTGADVAASIDSTGANGDWDLEYRSGLIEAATIAPQYSGRLATEITVTIDGTDDFTDLQTAITDVEAGGTIKFQIGDGFDFNIDTDGDSAADAYGIKLDSALSLSKNITIEGWSDFDNDGVVDANEKVVLDGNGSFQIMSVTEGKTVVLNNLQFQNGNTTGNGGAINNAGVLTITDSIFRNNAAAGDGGAINFSGSAGLLTISGTTFDGNYSTSAEGGAIAANSSMKVTITNSIFKNNWVAKYGGTGQWGGGAIYVHEKANVYVADSLFDGNRIGSSANAGYHGAAISVYSNSKAVVVRSTFVNHLNGVFAAAWSGGKIHVIDSIVVNNKGSAVYRWDGEIITYNSLVGNNGVDFHHQTGKAQTTYNTITTGVTTNISSINDVFGTDGAATKVTADEFKALFADGSFDSDGNVVLNADNTLTLSEAGETAMKAAVAEENGTFYVMKDGYWYNLDGTQKAQYIANPLVGYGLGETATIHSDMTPFVDPPLIVDTLEDTVADDGKTSLREAITEAITLFETNGAPSTITFSDTLTADANGEYIIHLDAAQGALTISVSGFYLTIDGSIGDARVTIDGGNSFTIKTSDGSLSNHAATGTQLFNITNSNVVLQDLQLKNGYTESIGGALYVGAGADVAVSNVLFQGNYAPGGGAIGLVGGKVTVEGSDFIYNCGKYAGTGTGSGGGGFYATSGTAVFRNSLFTQNTVIEGGWLVYQGASMFVAGSADLTVINSTYSGNYRGGIAMYGGKTTIINTTLLNNTPGGNAAALFSHGGSYTLLNSIVAGNNYDFGDNGTSGTRVLQGVVTTDKHMSHSLANGVLKKPFSGDYVAVSSADLLDMVSQDNVSNNKIVLNGDNRIVLSGKGAFSGAGVLVAQLENGSYVVVKNGYWYNLDNTRYQIDGADVAFKATDKANGYGLGATATVFDTDAAGNSRLNGTANNVFSAGAFAAAAHTTENGSLLVNTLDGTINAYDGKTSLAEAVAHAKTLGGDQTITFSGSLLMTNGERKINLSTVTLNTVNITIDGSCSGLGGKSNIILDGGGARLLFNVSGTTATLKNLTVQNASNGIGGAVSVAASATLNVENVTFSNNRANNWGGAINSTGTLNIRNSTFLNNNGGNWGGAIYAEGTLNVENSTFRGNKVATWGGAISMYRGTGTISNTLFEGNTSNDANNGSAIYTGANATTTLQADTFNGNTGSFAISADGYTYIDSALIVNNDGGIRANNRVDISNSTIAANSGSGLYKTTSVNLLVINSLIGNNTTDINAAAASTEFNNFYYVLTTGVMGNSATLSASNKNVTVMSADDFKGMFADGSFDATTGAAVLTNGSLLIKDNGTAAQGGVLVGRIGSTYYYMTGGKWYALDGTEKSDFDINATGYGLAEDAVVYTTAHNVDSEGNPVDRLRAMKQTPAAESIQIGAYAFNHTIAEKLAMITVTTLDDVVSDTDGLISLREAIENATLLDGNPAVRFAESLSGGTITLTSKLGAVTENLTINGDIDGDGEADITINGGGKYRFFDLSTADVTLTLNGLILQNGYSETAAKTNGGVINLSAAGVTVNLTNSTVTGSKNTAHAAVFCISAAGTTVNMTDSAFNNNTSFWSAPVLFSNQANTTVTITRSEFKNNNSSDAGNATTDGGVIYLGSGAHNSKLTITGSTFDGNSLAKCPGAALSVISSQNSVITISGSTFSNNSAGSSGGAIYMLDATGTTLDIENSTFTGNKANGTTVKTDNSGTGGGAIYVRDSGAVTIEDSTFTGNSSKACGGAILVRGGSLTLTDTDFTNNTAAHGGAISNYDTAASTITITGGTYSGNTSTSNSGTFHINSGANVTVKMTGITVENSSSDGVGGAMAIYGKAKVTLENVSFTNASTLNNGGAIGVSDGTLDISGSTFEDNSAKNNGGAIYISSGSTGTVDIRNSTFTNNSTTTSVTSANTLVGGGALYIGTGTVNISDSTFTGNHADGANGSSDHAGGGAIGLFAGTLNLTGTNTYTGNYAVEGHGGAIYNQKGTLNISGTNTFTGNKAGYGGTATDWRGNGGAIFLYNTAAHTMTITGRTLFEGNSARNWGGALALYDNSTNFIDGATFKNNSATKSSGSAIYVAGNVTITNSTFTGNYISGSTDVNTLTDHAVLDVSAKGRLYIVNSTFLNNSNAAEVISTVHDVYNRGGTANAVYLINSIYDHGVDAKTIGYGNVKAVAGTNIDATAKTDGNQTYFLPTGEDTVIGGKPVTVSGKTLTYNGTNIAISNLSTEQQTLLAGVIGKDQLGADRALGTTPYYSVGAVNGVLLAPENVTLKWTIGDYTYNGADQTVTVQVVNAENDTIVHDTITVTLKYNDGTADLAAMLNAGSYTVTVDETALLAALGYNQTLVAAADALTKTVTVKPKTLNVTADNKEMFLDGVVPELTYTVTTEDLVDGDDAGFTGELKTTADGTVEGDFAIEAGTLTIGNTNYIMNYTPGTLKVTDANGVLDPSRLVVDTASDDPDSGNTLREALEYAADFGGDLTITFAADTFAANTKLTLNSELTISLDLEGTITIDGSYVDTDGNTGRITIDNTGKTFRVLSYADTDTTTAAGLTINNLEILGGTTATRGQVPGMGIYSTNITLTLEHFRLIGAKTGYGTSQAAGGAGIYHSGGNITISDSQFIGNKLIANGYTANGGAIYVAGAVEVKISDSLFEENYAIYGNGGAIFASGAAVVTIDNTIFRDNFVLTNGGAIYGGQGSKFSISDSTFTGNIAGGAGGAIHTMKGYISISGSSFTDNQAGDGGAIYTWYTFNAADSVFTDNRTSSGTAYEIKNSDGTTFLKDVSFGGSGHGGAVFFNAPSGDNANIVNTTFFGNTAVKRGGAMYIVSAGYGHSVDIVNTTIAGNTAGVAGGGIHYYASTADHVLIANSIILGNKAGTADYDIAFAQNAHNDKHYIYSVASTIGVVKHEGYTTGYVFDKASVQAPITDKYGSTIGEIWTVTEQADGTFAQTLTTSNMSVTDLKKAVFGTETPTLDPDGKSVVMMASKDYVLNGVNTAWTADGIQPLYQDANGDWYYVSGTKYTGTPTVIDKDINGAARPKDINGTSYYVKGSSTLLREYSGLVVDTLEDVINPYDFKTSLREAVAFANANGGGTITFSKDVDWSATDKTITLDAKDAEGNFLGQIAITAAITIDGSLMRGTFDHGVVTIKVPVTYGESVLDTTLTASDFRIFNITATTTLKNMILQGGKVTDHGGAVYANQANKALTLNTVQVMDSYASGRGGGVYNDGYTRAENSVFINNTAGDYGGGLASYNGDIRVLNTLFYGNRAKNGAAVMNWGGKLEFINSISTGNYASDGASIQNNQKSIYLLNSVAVGAANGYDVKFNNAYNNTMRFYNSVYGTITEGVPADGSGLYNYVDSNSCIATKAMTFGDNTIYQDSKGFYAIDILDQGAASWGGKIFSEVHLADHVDQVNNNYKMVGYFDENGYFRNIDGLLVAFSGANNSNTSTVPYYSNDNGTTWYTDTACTKEFYDGYMAGTNATTTVRQNMFLMTRTGIEQVFPEKGAFTYSTLTGMTDEIYATWFTDWKYDRNGADRTAEKYLAIGTTVHDNTLDRLTDLENNLTVTSEGTAIDAADGVITLNEALLVAGRLGTAEITFGDNISELVITQQIVINYDLTITAAEGQNITFRTAAQGVADDGTYDSAAANTNRIFNLFYDGSLTLNNLTLSGGKVTGSGAIIYGENASSVTINNSTLENGYATGDGGAIYLTQASSLQIKDSVFRNNHAGSGGAIALRADGDILIENTLFEKNTAATGGAIMLAQSNSGTYIYRPHMIVNDSVFRENGKSDWGNKGGGAIRVNDGTLAELHRCFLDRNTVTAGSWYGTNGGALSATGSASILLESSTVINSQNGAIASDGGKVTVINSTIMNNGGRAFFQGDANQITVVNSIVALNGQDFCQRDHAGANYKFNLKNVITTGTLFKTGMVFDTDQVTVLSAADFKALLEDICLDEAGKVILNPILGNTYTFDPASIAAQNGVLVGKIGNAYYYAKNGLWYSVADGSVYQIDDGTGTMVDVAYTNDAATNYGLGTAEGTAVYTLDQNSNERFMLNGKLTVGASNARQESLIVTDATDENNPYNNKITLREAIDLANRTADAQEVTFDSTVFKDTATEYVIDLESTLKITDAVTISNTTGAKIVLNGGNTVTIDAGTGAVTYGEDGVRIMDIAADAATTIDGLTFRNGFGSSDLRTTAKGFTYGGGGAILTASALTVKNSTFEFNYYKNQADNPYSSGGGAIFANADLTVENSTFSQNGVSLKSIYAYKGGSAIFVQTGSFTLTGSTIKDHTTGPAVYAYNTTGLNIDQTTFTNNKRGALSLSNTSGADQKISNSIFTGNAHTNGASGAINAQVSSGTLTISNTTFGGTGDGEGNRNSGGNGGGAVTLNSGNNGKIVVTDSKFINNYQKDIYGGGAAYILGNVTFRNTLFQGNSTGATGGAISVMNGNPVIENCTFVSNSAKDGGAININSVYGVANTVNIVNSTFLNNTATGTGNTILVLDPSLTNEAGRKPMTVNLINSTILSDDADSAAIQLGYNNVTLNVLNSIVASATALNAVAGSTVNAHYNVTGAVSLASGTTLNGTALTADATELGGTNKTAEAADIFKSTTLTAQNTLEISNNGAATITGTLVGQKDGAFYYRDGSTWKKVGGTDADNLAFDAADTVTYGLTDGTILTLAQNGVSRVLTLTAFNAGAHALELAPLSSVVNSLEDSINYFDDNITLREAIANFNSVSFSDQVDWSLTDKTIVLTMGQLYHYGSFSLNGALSFNGTDQGRVTVKVPVTYAESLADTTLTISNHRAFQFAAEDTKWTHVQLSNIIVKGGYADNGGAIQCSPNLTLTNVTVADSKGWAGGGIAASNNLVLQNSYIVNNFSTAFGGGIYLTKGATGGYGHPKIENSVIAGNTSSAGAGIYISCNASGIITQIINTTIAGNTGKSAFYQGNQSSTLRVINSIVAGNAVTENEIDLSNTNASLINSVYGTISTSAATTITESATVSGVSYEDVFGTNTLTKLADGTYELAVIPTGKAAVTGTLVASVVTGNALGGTVNKDYYYLDTATGKWMLNGAEAGYTYDATAANYGLGVNNAVILGTALNRDAGGNFVSRLDAAPYSTFTAGAYALTAETAGTVVKVGTDNGFFNPFDGEVTLRDAVTYAGVGALGSEVTFDDALTEVVLTDTLTIGKDLTITDDNMKISGAALAVAESVTLTVSSGSKFEITEAVNNGTVDNKGTLTLGTLSGTGTFVNNGTATVTGNLTQANVTNNQSMTVSGNYETTENTDNAAGAELTVSGTLTTEDLGNGGTLTATGNIAVTDHLENTGTLTASAAFSAATTDNSGSLAVSGDFSGGAVNNTGNMTLSGASNTATDATKLGNVTYDGATAQQVITGTYAALILSGAGAKTATGNVTANSVKNESETTINGNLSSTGTVDNDANLTVNGNLSAGTTDNSADLKVTGTYTADTTNNSATLDVNGNFAGGAVTNTGSMSLAGETNSGTGTLGNVTYDGADQTVIAGTYGNLTINSTGKATATGNISATGDVMNEAETEIIGDLTAANRIFNTKSQLTVGGSVEAEFIYNEYPNANMNVAGDLTAVSKLSNSHNAQLTVGGSVEAGVVLNDYGSNMAVTGDLTAAVGLVNMDESQLTVGGSVNAQETENDLSSMEVSGNFSGGDVTNTGAMTLSGASNSGSGTLGDVTYNGTSDQEVIAGTYEDLVISTTGNATANGDISAATVKSDAETAITGNLTATGNITSNGDMDVTGNLTATGDLASTAALTVSGNASANNATLSGETTITGDLTATGTVDSDAALTVGGDFTADTADNSSDLTVGGNFSATTTNNSGTLDAAGDLNAGALTNSGSISVAGAFATTSTDLGAVEYDGTAAQNVVEGTYSDLSLTGGDKSLAGAVTVTDSLTADANIDTAGQDLTLSGDVAGSGTISTTTDSGTVTYDGADQNVLAGAYNNLALANGTKTLNSANTTTVNDTFTATGTTIQSDTADVLASLTVKDAGDDSTPSSAIAGTTFNGIALNNTGSADGYLYVNADTNNADDATTGVYLVGNVFVAAEGIIYGDTLGEVYITVTNGNGDVISEGTADDLGWTWAVGNDAIENATTGTAYELVSKAGYKFRFHGDVDVVIGKRAITVKADDLEIDTGDDPVFTYTYVGELVGSDAFTGELASEGDGSQPGDFAITQGTLSLGDNYDLTFIGGTLTVEGGGQDAHQFPNYNNPGNFAGVYDAPVHSTTHSYDHHESVPTLEHQNDRSIGFLFSVSNKQLGDASGAFGDSAPQGSSVNIHAHTLSDLLKSYDKSEQIIASPANEIEDAKDDMKDLHDFSNNPFGILPDDEDLHTRAYDESIDFTVIGEDNLSTAKAAQFKDEFDAALEELLTLA